MGNGLKTLRTRRGWSQAQAGTALGYSQAAYGKIENGQRRMSVELAERAAKLYGVSTAVVMGNEPLTETTTPALTDQVLPQPNARIGGPVDLRPTGEMLPVYGKAQGGCNGEFIFNGNELAYLPAPPFLRGVTGAYAVYVDGESMEPRYLAGETVYVHPHKPIRANDFVVIQLSTGDGEAPHGFIKQFISRDAKRVKLRQFNPTKTVEFPASRVVSIHKIVGSEHI